MDVRTGARIVVIGAGGTVGSSRDEFDNLKAVAKGQEILERILADTPTLATRFRVKLKHTWSLLSEDIHPSDWGEISYAIAREINDPTDPPYGIVVTHGTDTLAYTASAISFMFHDLPIPIVFTGSLLPSEYPGSDAAQNLNDSILLAANSRLGGVFVVFKWSKRDERRRILIANQTLSIPSYGSHFSSVDGSTHGWVSEDRVVLSDTTISSMPRRKSPMGQVNPETNIDDRVKLVKVYPGFRPDDLVKLAERDCRGIILQLYHSGTACTRDVARQSLSLAPAVMQCRRQLGVLVFGLPSEHGDSAHVYRSTRLLLDAGLIPLPAMSLEAAYVKLAWLFGQSQDADRVAALMAENIRGEVAAPSLSVAVARHLRGASDSGANERTS